MSEQESQKLQKSNMKFRSLRSICTTVVVISVLSCLFLAIWNSKGLTKVKVTALEKTVEPVDHNIPLFKKKEALPDYEVVILLNDGGNVRLGSKNDTSAKETLSWTLSNPVSLSQIASVRLQEQDKLISDTVVEVQIEGHSVKEKGYQFEFESELSLSAGIAAFFETPIGKAIVLGFIIAVVLLFFSV